MKKNRTTKPEKANDCKDKKEIKQLLKNYKRMNKKLLRELESYGFHIEKSKKHFRVYVNDQLFILSCTSSDHREGKNIAAMICRAM